VAGLVAPVYVIAGVVPLLLDRVPPQMAAWAAGAVVLVALAIASGWYGEARAAIARAPGAAAGKAPGRDHAALGRAAESAVAAWRTAVVDALAAGPLARRELGAIKPLEAITRDLGAVAEGLRAAVERAADGPTDAPLRSAAVVSRNAAIATAGALDTAGRMADRMSVSPLVKGTG
jgi:hypothetical protein